MTVITMTYEAKCKHCKFFEKGKLLKNDGTESKRTIHFCNNKKSKRDHQALTLKDKACDKLELV